MMRQRAPESTVIVYKRLVIYRRDSGECLLDARNAFVNRQSLHGYGMFESAQNTADSDGSVSVRLFDINGSYAMIKDKPMSDTYELYSCDSTLPISRVFVDTIYFQLSITINSSTTAAGCNLRNYEVDRCRQQFAYSRRV